MAPEWLMAGLPAGAVAAFAVLWWRMAQLEEQVAQLTKEVRRLTVSLARTAPADALTVLSE